MVLQACQPRALSSLRIMHSLIRLQSITAMILSTAAGNIRIIHFKRKSVLKVLKLPNNLAVSFRIVLCLEAFFWTAICNAYLHMKGLEV